MEQDPFRWEVENGVGNLGFGLLIEKDGERERVGWFSFIGKTERGKDVMERERESTLAKVLECVFLPTKSYV